MHYPKTDNTINKGLPELSVKVLGISVWMIMSEGSASCSHVWNVIVEEELVRKYLLIIVDTSLKCVVFLADCLIFLGSFVLDLTLRFLGGLDGLLPSTCLFLGFFLV